MEIWLMNDNNSESLRLPVLPSEYEVTTANNNTVANIADFGELNLIGKSKLAEAPLSSFFPAQYYPNLCEYSGFPSPYACIALIERWRKSGKPIRYIVVNGGIKNVNMPAAIESFNWKEQDGTHDVYYTLTLKEYPLVNQPQGSTTITAGNYKVVPYNPPTHYGNSRPTTRNIPTTYRVKTDSNIYDLTKFLTGNGSNWYKIYLLNSLTSTTVSAGTVLKL